jgi:hypothetical protein
MEVKEKILYLYGLIEEIKDGIVDDYEVSCSEFNAWCSVLRRNATSDENKAINELEQTLRDYQTKRNGNLKALEDCKRRLALS